MGETCANGTLPEPLRRRLRRYRRALTWPIYLHVYCRFLYRPHMRLIHRFGRHWMKRLGPFHPGDSVFYRCDWCGEHKPQPPTDR